ncbi:unknown [Prevotella sp. CAG:617]|nr:unknown [Prevotella sp. CAG:617]
MMLQQQVAGTEVLAVRVNQRAILSFLNLQFLLLTYVNHRLANGFVGRRNRIVTGNVPRFETTVVHRIANTLITNQVTTVAYRSSITANIRTGISRRVNI